MNAADLIVTLFSMYCGAVLGWLAKTWRVEVREFAEWQRRDDEWDREHGVNAGQRLSVQDSTSCDSSNPMH